MKLYAIFSIYFVFLPSLLLFPKLSQAQIGVKLGTTISNFYSTGNLSPKFDYDIDLRPYLGYDIEIAQLGSQSSLITPYISAYYNFQISKKLGFRPELSFTQKGVKFSQYDYERIIYKARISYVELPLSFFYQFIQGEKTISELYFGGYGVVKIVATKEISSPNNPKEKRQVNSANGFDGGLLFGANYKRKISEHFLLVDIRIFIGLSDIFSIPSDWTSIYFETQKVKTTGINLTLGYEF